MILKQNFILYFHLKVTSLLDKWYGESQKRTAAIFSLAKKLQPAIIFIDEIDSFMRTRHNDDHECTRMVRIIFKSNKINQSILRSKLNLWDYGMVW